MLRPRNPKQHGSANHHILGELLASVAKFEQAWDGRSLPPDLHHMVDISKHGPIIRNMSNYQTDNHRLAEIFKALANPHRLEILGQLTACCVPGTVCVTETDNRRCVGELGKTLNIAPSTLSHHIKELNRAGLVRMERRGKFVECWVDPELLEELAQFFQPSALPGTSLKDKRTA